MYVIHFTTFKCCPKVFTIYLSDLEKIINDDAVTDVLRVIIQYAHYSYIYKGGVTDCGFQFLC